jgi:outer membrane protein OmpA-like peptidoglycan-associated protein
MAKKVIRLTEADVQKIVDKIILEQNEKTSYFELGPEILSIGPGNKLYISYVKDKLVTPLMNINGILSEFSVNPKTKFILNKGFKDNMSRLNTTWRAFTTDEKPMQHSFDKTVSADALDYRFIALTPQGFEDAGLPRIYTAKIKLVKKNDAEDILEKYTETTFEEGLRPYTYISVNRKGNDSIFGERYIYYLKLYPGRRPGRKYSTDGGGEITKPIKLSLNLEDVFKFDEINFKNESEAMTKINDFAKAIQNNIENEKHGELFRRQMNAKLARNPILGYASIDGDPEGNVPEDKGYGPCSGQKRKDYNKCLSEARAKRVADMLNDKFSDDNMINFKYEGMGETDQLSNPKGKKWPDYKPNETGENRRIVLDLGEFTLSV